MGPGINPAEAVIQKRLMNIGIPPKGHLQKHAYLCHIDGLDLRSPDEWRYVVRKKQFQRTKAAR
jgi:hypothetical protein